MQGHPSTPERARLFVLPWTFSSNGYDVARDEDLCGLMQNSHTLFYMTIKQVVCVTMPLRPIYVHNFCFDSPPGVVPASKSDPGWNVAFLVWFCLDPVALCNDLFASR